MKVSTMLILGAAGAGAYFMLRRPAGTGAPQSNQRQAFSAAPVPMLRLNAPGKMFSTTSNVGKAPAPQTGAPSGRDITAGLAAAGAGAACAALIPGVGAAASPLCGAAGSYVGAKAYDYGQKAWDEVSSWF